MILLFLGFIGSPAFAQTVSSETRIILKSVSERYKKLSVWKARFTQETYSVGLGSGTLSEGEFEFSAPNKFRYSILRPAASDFISNGKEAWQIIYKKGRGQAPFVRHFRDLKKIDLQKYLMILKGIDWNGPKSEKALAENFSVEGKITNDEISLELKPRQASEIVSLVMLFKNSIEPPSRVIIRDALDAQTNIVVTSFEILKTAIDAKHFAPVLPKGSEVEEL